MPHLEKVKEHLLKRDIQVLPWPGNSPDIAPIENLFAIVKNKLRQKDTTTKQKLIRAILDIWNGDPSIAEISCQFNAKSSRSGD